MYLIDSETNLQHQRLNDLKLDYEPTAAMTEQLTKLSSLSTLINLKLDIIDFSPEWDYTSGGTKMLIWFKPDLQKIFDSDWIDIHDIVESRLAIRFGDSEVPVKIISSGVLKWHVPPNPPGYVSLYLLYDGKIVQNSKPNNHLFQYREDQQTRKKVFVRMSESHDSMLEKEPREFKVRLIERLSGLEMELKQYNNNYSQQYNHSDTINFDKLQHLDNKILEKINRGYFIRVIRLLFKKLTQVFPQEKVKALVDKIDKYGMNLTHYIVLLDYYELIQDLFNIGANLSLPTSIPNSTMNMVPIVICSGKGFQNTLSELLKYVSLPYSSEKEVRLEDQELIIKSNSVVLSPTTRALRDQADRSDGGSDYEEHKVIDGALEMAFKNRQHEIAEIILRDMTLQKALKTDNSSENGDIEPKYQQLLRNFYSNDQDVIHDSEEMLKGRIKDLWSTSKPIEEYPQRNVPRENMIKLNDSQATNSYIENNSEDDDSYFIKNAQGYKIEVITDEVRANNFTKNTSIPNNRNLNVNDQYRTFNTKSKIKKSSSSNNKQIDSLVEMDMTHCQLKKCKKRINMLHNLKDCIKDLKQVEKIQRNVKRWLLRRQAWDIHHASDVIQKQLNQQIIGKSCHKIDQKEAIILIQRTVRNWLSDK